MGEVGEGAETGDYSGSFICKIRWVRESYMVLVFLFRRG